MEALTWNMSRSMAIPTTLRRSILPISPFHSLNPTCNSVFKSSSSAVFLSLRRSLSSSMAQSSHQAVAAGDAAQEVDVLQRIQSHQEKAARLSPVQEIRTVLANSVRGMLSTFSQKYDGYPSGSMVDFACDADGLPILAVSSLAVHTKLQEYICLFVLLDAGGGNFRAERRILN